MPASKSTQEDVIIEQLIEEARVQLTNVKALPPAVVAGRVVYDVGFDHEQQSKDRFIDVGSDVSKITKFVVKKYAAKKTEINEFAVSEPASLSQLSTVSIDTQGKITEVSDNQPSYITKDTSYKTEKGEISARVILNSYSQTELLSIAINAAKRETQDKFTFVKGKTSDPKALNGNDILRDVEYQAVSGPPNPPVKPQVARAMSHAIVNSNATRGQFIPDNPRGSHETNNVDDQLINYVGTSVTTALSDDGLAETRKLGVSSTKFSVMAKLGRVLMNRAAGELGSFDRRYDPYDPERSQEGAPGTAQIGTRIESEKLRAYDAIEKIYDIKGISGSDYVNISELSWGAMTTPGEPFHSFSNSGITALALALTLSTAAVFGVLSFVESLAPRPTRTHNAKGRLIFGKHEEPIESKGTSLLQIFGNGEDVTSRLGFVRTRNDYFSAYKAGMYEFMGKTNEKLTLGSAINALAVGANVGSSVANSFDGGGVGALAGGVSAAVAFAAAASFPRVSQIPGYYATVFRSLVKDTVGLKDSIKNLGSGITGLVSGIENIQGMIDAIGQSKVVKFMNIFASIGDIVLDAKRASESSSDRTSKWSFNDPDLYPVGAPKSEFIRRYAGNSGRKAAWASDQVRSNLIYHSEMLAAKLDFDGIQKENIISNKQYLRLFAQGRSSKTKIVDAKIGQRISDDDRIAVEKELDAQYVPFYFHDLRTNEIVAFHAFLSGLTDSYAAAWDGTSAYGRMDTPKIYKETTRKMSMSFHVVAMSEDDMREMYLKLNKLTTLVYPQWSEGDVYTKDKDNSFIQPFTQHPTASPLVRIRLGDLIHSNYSKFALARLFGLGTDKLAIDGERFDGAKREALLTELQKLSFLNKGEIDVSQIIKNNAYQLDTSTKYVYTKNSTDGVISLSSPVQIGKSVTKANSFEVSSLHATKLKVHSVSYDTNTIIASFAMRDSYKGLGLEIEDWVNKEGQDGQYEIPVASLKDITFEEVENIVGNKGSVGKKTLEFFSEENNSIVRSFKSSGGRGLACAIESLDMDWFDGEKWSWETEAKGMIAPMSCHVKMSMTPIHDIAPGLDSNGYNRAPIYPVGYDGFAQK